MPDPIRPSLTPPLNATPAVPPQARAQALAAQKAFFQAALTKAAATAPAAPVSAPARPAPAAASKPIVAAAPEPGRYLRPGSRLDITV